ncbi:EAL domain-containing protein [Marinobacter persicus]|uniref:Diguanylate cyclase/phosphodiesterase n=1 Tax=Marinobacter persicus TaxID=930118 RepID=A0A2S6G2T6_9GAMM|nr:GGDEF domain-containing phosphodiesterase [Marinobacter persicus]PPK49962.1 diguanylate cyclase/phosphodiesterase [Marinobacter persicus]PPK51879.1 diguanylate cyclase/phosphodiesterase [Marinobacter persicus]PPK56546.1 diguanylate cyclase/phosphodiesterase [Marinobacter persicus]
MLFLFLVVVVLLGTSVYTYIQDRKLQSVSLDALRMASWNLVQLGNEAGDLDLQIGLMSKGAGDPDELMLRYDILWSRYDYLLNSKESAPTRQHGDNKAQLDTLFADLKALEPAILAAVNSGLSQWDAVMRGWEPQKTQIRNLVTDNFVGDETSRLMSNVQASRNRLANLRLLTLISLMAVFVYFVLALFFVRRQSRTDPVTGLPNNNYLRTVRQVSGEKTIIICEIRQLQLVRSDFGDHGANELSSLYASKLLKELMPGDELIHISQSEFLMFLQPRAEQTLEQTASQLVEATTFDWHQPNSVLHISAVFGIDPPCQEVSGDWSTRYQQAHRALAQAHIEDQAFYINGEDLRRRIAEDAQIHAGLIKFLNREPGSLSLHLVYQPIVSAVDQNFITGAEVLLRCRHDDLGFIPPNRVVNLCERLGLGLSLGRWLFREVARETRYIYQHLGFRGHISINLNPAMLTHKLADDVKELLIDGGIPPSTICMEITEDNAALEFGSINQLIERLKAMGITFALDDFGTGHSSLEYLRELKVDRLKIDRCFVDGIETSDDKARFLGSIIAMADQAYMKSVIEGVENQEQWLLVREMGGSLIQGYFAHKPMPMDDYTSLLLDLGTDYPRDIRLSPQRAPVD